MNCNKYRWIALVVSCLINLCIGSVYAWSVFANPLAEAISAASGHEITSLSIVFTIANAVGPVTMISGGFINDRLGSKWVIMIGGLLFGAGMISSGFARSVGMLIVSYGICVGFGIGMIYGCTVSSSIKLFSDKRGLVGGITTASYGISSVLIPPVANWLIESTGIAGAMKLLGAVMLVIIVAGGFIFSWCFRVYSSTMEKNSTPADTAGMNWKMMLKTPYFYVMIIMLCMGAVSGLMITSQASPLAQGIFGVPAADAAVIVSVLALFNTAGRLLSGAVSDKAGIINTLRITFIIFIVSFVAGTILEYAASFGMEKILGFVAWNYSSKFMHINGRVCLVYSLFWGILGIFWVRLIMPNIIKLINKIDYKQGMKFMYIALTFLAFDTVLTFAAVNRAKEFEKGIAPQNRIEECLDKYFGLDYLNNMYNNRWGKIE